jgi:hypothetical protein
MKHSRELREESPATNQLRSSRKNYRGCMSLPSDIVSDRDSRFIPHLWQRTDESPRYQAIDVHRLPSTSRRPDRANQRGAQIVPTPRARRTSLARRARLRHRRFRDNQLVLRELRLPTKDAARDCYLALPGVTDPRTTPQQEREAHGILGVLERLPT